MEQPQQPSPADHVTEHHTHLWVVAPLALAGFHLTVGYTAVRLDCGWSLLPSLAGWSQAQLFIVGLTAVATVAGVALTALTLRAWRAVGDLGDEEASSGARQLILFVGLVLDGLVVVYLLWSLLPSLAIGVC